MAVLVQLKTPPIEPKRLEALKKAISHRKILLEKDSLSGSEDENQEIDVVEGGVDPLHTTTLISSIQDPSDVGSSSNLLSTQPQSTMDSCGISSPPEDPPPQKPPTYSDSNPSNNDTTVPLTETPTEVITSPIKANSNEALLAELEGEEERIVKKIEKLKEEKHKLFIAFKKIITEENEEGAVQESDPEDDKNTETLREKSSSPIDIEDSKKSHDPTHSRESSFNVPNPAFKRRRSPANAPPPNYNNNPSSYRKSSRTGASTRGGGAFHYPGRGRAFVSQYPVNTLFHSPTTMNELTNHT
ncbi:hypothetical protein K493DRAFT_302768 [Basidiobolus meristosporus CBS 931.73]|uniref:Uncharacterized protein n=1 Tax=Basidiobolus meristosporus CBS 931.73 TaxID=1314790 RepID=A0A1Y1Y5K2_9FUNG|nr:hypothetical protein K493DRAFT_302768 [Basidiobolus meristosporus CBS 931.73]|eukprot:ORX93300.1 hypothetical protein K493DRAFT_302768 [Basidiobolus meristosporus CBS 931.73]